MAASAHAAGSPGWANAALGPATSRYAGMSETSIGAPQPIASSSVVPNEAREVGAR